MTTTTKPTHTKQLLAGWEVETCVELPVLNDGYGSCDLDNAVFRRFDCATKAEAEKLAKTLLPKDCFGSVAITEFIREPYEPGCPALRKEYVGDSEHIENP